VSGNVPPIAIVDEVTPGSSRGAPVAAVTAMPATIAVPANIARILPFIPIRPSMTLGLPRIEKTEAEEYDVLGSD
jgi:hypothetical protein